MKNSFLLILISVTFYSNAQVKFDETFSQIGNSKLPYGEMITLSGKLNKQVDSLTVVLSYMVFSSDGGNNIKKSKKYADLKGMDWDVQFEPLPANSKISISFKTVSNVADREREELSNLLKLDFNKVVDIMTDGSIPLNASADKAKEIIIGKFKKSLDISFRNYRVGTGKTLYDGIISSMSEKNIDEWIAFINNSHKLQQFQDDYKNLAVTINDSVKVGSKKKSELAPFIFEEPNLADILRILKSKTSGAIANSFDDLINRYIGNDNEKAYAIRFAELKAFKENPAGLSDAKLMASTSYVTSSYTESVESNELLKYAGIDMAAIVFPKSKDDSNPAFVGYYFLLSPYLHEIFGYTPPKRWMSNLTPTIGWGLSSSLADVKTPFFYTGLSYKINGAFRFTTGTTFFKNDNAKPEFEWMFGAGFSLQLSSVGDLIRLFNAAKTQFPSSNQQSSN
jgi:hypothetical protein